MEELDSKLGYKQEHSSSYYPQVNGQVEVVNKSLNSIIQRTIAYNKMNWHLLCGPIEPRLILPPVSLHISLYMWWSLFCRLNAKSLL